MFARASTLFALGLLSLAVVGACAGPSDCERMGEAICAKACACNGGAACRFVQPGAGVTATTSEESCNRWFTDTCQGPEQAAVDYAACEAAAPQAACVDDRNPIDGLAKAASLPSACGKQAK